MVLNFFGKRKRVAPAHTFVAVGYPKVGNTWLRMTLGRYVQKLANLPELPLFEPNDAEELTRAIGSQAAGYFTHAPLEWDTQVASDLGFDNTVRPFADQKVILLTRHPLDALVSHFMHNRKKLNESDRFPDSLIDFVNHPVFGLEKFLQFHELWQSNRGRVDALLVWRYEDARSDPVAALKRTVDFLGWAWDDSVARDAVEYASFENMQKLERGSQSIVYRSSGFKVFGEGDAKDPDAYHVRKGRVQGFRDELSADIIMKLESDIKKRLFEAYGYP